MYESCQCSQLLNICTYCCVILFPTSKSSLLPHSQQIGRCFLLPFVVFCYITSWKDATENHFCISFSSLLLQSYSFGNSQLRGFFFLLRVCLNKCTSSPCFLVHQAGKGCGRLCTCGEVCHQTQNRLLD